MNVDALITLVILLAFLVLTVTGRLAVDIALAAAMTGLLLFGVLTPMEAFQGFAHPAIYTIACFYIVSAALKESGALHWWVSKWLGKHATAQSAMPRIMAPIAFVSSIISNTPVVAIFIPLIQDWANWNKNTFCFIFVPNLDQKTFVIHLGSNFGSANFFDPNLDQFGSKM